jgi:hypothetical protein
MNGFRLEPGHMRALLAATLLVLGACGGDPAGACEGVAGTTKYCYDNYTADQCSDFEATQMNSANWLQYPGQTCATRGCNHPGGSKC